MLMLMLMTMYSLIYVGCIALQELIELNYNKEIMSSIIVRTYHSIGCIYYITPILLNTENSFLEVESSKIPSDVDFVLKRSAYFFLWDTINLLIGNEEEKTLYILHHLLSLFTISYSVYYEINWYFVSIGLFLAEITNPITQISEACKLFNYYNNVFEKYYFYYMLLIRGFFSPLLILLTVYNILYLYSIYGMDVINLSILINYFTIFSITTFSIDWLGIKYEYIMIRDIIKKIN